MDSRNALTLAVLVLSALVLPGYKDGTILDPADGKIYKAELWAEDGKLKVRGYLGVFYKTQTWIKGN